MSVINQDVAQEQVTASTVEVYSAPTASNFESAIIEYGNVVNVSSSDVTLIIYIVQTGGSPATTNIYFPETTIFAGRSNPLTSIIGRKLKNGDEIHTLASAASALNLSIGIKEIYTDT